MMISSPKIGPTTSAFFKFIAASALRVAVLLSLMLTASIASAQAQTFLVDFDNSVRVLELSVSSGQEVTLEAVDSGSYSFVAWASSLGASDISNNLLPARGVNPFTFTAPISTEDLVLKFTVEFADSNSEFPVAFRVEVTVTAAAVVDNPTTFTQIDVRSLGISGGPQTVDVSGNFNDPDVSSSADLTFTATSGTEATATVVISATGELTITPVAAGTSVITVTAQEGSNAAASQMFTVTVTVMANAGPDQTVSGGDQVTLGLPESSFPSGFTVLSWGPTDPADPAFSRLIGSFATNIPNPTFEAPRISGENLVLVFELILANAVDEILKDTVIITVTASAQTMPTATGFAGPDQIVSGGDQVTLGLPESSFPSGFTLLTWGPINSDSVDPAFSSLTAPFVATNILNPTFKAPRIKPGENLLLVFELTLANAEGEILRDTVIITVVPASNNAPTANAGDDQAVIEGVDVTLDGSGSSDDRAIRYLTYSWTQTGGTTVTLRNPTAQSPRFTAPFLRTLGSDLTLTFSLTVTDANLVSSSADTVMVTIRERVSADPPTANAGDDQTVDQGVEVTLDGSGTDDVTTPAYAWTQTGGTPVTLSDPTARNPRFTAPSNLAADEELTFSLTVTEFPATEADTVTITVRRGIAFAPVDGGAFAPVDGGAFAPVDGSGASGVGGASGASGALGRPSAASPPQLGVPPVLNPEADDGSATEAVFRGGASSDEGENYFKDGAFSVSEAIEVVFVITPRASHVGEQANVVIAARMRSAPESVWLLTESGQLEPYDGETLVSFKEGLTLEVNSFITLTPDEPITLTVAEVGDWELFVGYQLANGELFYHLEPLRIETME